MSNIIPKYSLEDPLNQNDFNFYKSDELVEFMAQDQNPHSHNYYILSFLYSGSILHLADFESDRITAPAILLLDIDRVHTHPILHDCVIKSIGFSQRFIKDRGPTFFNSLNKIFSRPFIKISKGEIERIDEIIHLMENRSFNSTLETELTQSLLDALVTYCAILSDQNPSTEKTLNEIYARFRILLKKHYTEHHEVSFYADSLNISTSVLTHQVKHSTFKTPKQLIDEHLLLEAKRILYWSDITSKELSWKLGFETDSYFSRFFKKYTGLTPKEFQKNSILNRIL
ncbi:helix-turn-helix domain-containing protein [Pedobacter rhizosphaerae]|uniref:AraC-type DNA-binding protein n=1 Tax=Pedobacter rhizosphaerae TaxID=390241 RepID=A0A1H9VQA7_9SPHI|nr:helix-turn-helix domain-containing protein [Pedobacter rhizosphaerae]SES23772.1 AraC-type DNA-binding protein [Pedobacter rhizosphaerae]